jgi:hypothetical protein
MIYPFLEEGLERDNRVSQQPVTGGVEGLDCGARAVGRQDAAVGVIGRSES